MRIKSTFIFITIFSAAFLNATSWAQTEPMNVTLSPVSIQLEATPGQKVNSQIRVRNNGTIEETLKLSVGTFVADQTGESPKLIEPSEADKFVTWVKFDQEQISVFPGEWKEVGFSIDVPTDASLAYYYLIYLTEADFSATPGATNVTGSPAISVLLNVKSPNTIKELKLTNFSTKNYVVESLPKEFEIEIANLGNTHGAPFGNIFIDGQGKKDLAVLPLNSNNNVVLPNGNRTYKVTWADGFPVKGTGLFGFDWDLSKVDHFRMGKYTAHVLAAYDNGERDVAMESVLSFWVIPWKILIAGTVVLALSLMGLWSTLKSIKSKLFKR